MPKSTKFINKIHQSSLSTCWCRVTRHDPGNSEPVEHQLAMEHGEEGQHGFTQPMWLFWEFTWNYWEFSGIIGNSVELLGITVQFSTNKSGNYWKFSGIDMNDLTIAV